MQHLLGPLFATCKGTSQRREGEPQGMGPGWIEQQHRRNGELCGSRSRTTLAVAVHEPLAGCWCLTKQGPAPYLTPNFLEFRTVTYLCVRNMGSIQNGSSIFVPCSSCTAREDKKGTPLHLTPFSRGRHQDHQPRAMSNGSFVADVSKSLGLTSFSLPPGSRARPTPGNATLSFTGTFCKSKQNGRPHSREVYIGGTLLPRRRALCWWNPAAEESMSYRMAGTTGRWQMDESLHTSSSASMSVTS